MTGRSPSPVKSPCGRIDGRGTAPGRKLGSRLRDFDLRRLEVPSPVSFPPSPASLSHAQLLLRTSSSAILQGPEPCRRTHRVPAPNFWLAFAPSRLCPRVAVSAVVRLVQRSSRSRLVPRDVWMRPDRRPPSPSFVEPRPTSQRQASNACLTPARGAGSKLGDGPGRGQSLEETEEGRQEAWPSKRDARTSSTQTSNYMVAFLAALLHDRVRGVTVSMEAFHSNRHSFRQGFDSPRTHLFLRMMSRSC